MKYTESRGGSDRPFPSPEHDDCGSGGARRPGGRGDRGHHGHGNRGHGGRGFGARRHMFDYGELRLLLLALIASRPCHGYELIRRIEERFGGAYVPSPGVIYPTLSWLDDMGLAEVLPGDGNRKSYSITPEGEAYLAENRAAADALLARSGGEGPGRHGLPLPVLRAMENLKLAMRLRLRGRPVDEAAAMAIAAALDSAAQAVERS